MVGTRRLCFCNPKSGPPPKAVPTLRAASNITSEQVRRQAAALQNTRNDAVEEGRA